MSESENAQSPSPDAGIDEDVAEEATPKFAPLPTLDDEAWLQCEDVAERLFRTERDYLWDTMKTLEHSIVGRLRAHVKCERTILDEKDINAIFGSVPPILSLNDKLFEGILELRHGGKRTLALGLGDLLISFMPYFKVFMDYITRYKDAVQMIERLKNKTLYMKFREFLEITEATYGKSVAHFLSAPVDRLPMYLQFVAQLTAYFPRAARESREYKTLNESLDMLRNLTGFIARRVNFVKSQRQVVELQERWGSSVEVMAPNRYVVMDTVATVIMEDSRRSLLDKSTAMLTGETGQRRKLILCNDCLIHGSKRSLLKPVFSLGGLAALDLDDTENHKFIVMLKSMDSDGCYLVSYDSLAEKRKWLDQVTRLVAKDIQSGRPTMDSQTLEDVMFKEEGAKEKAGRFLGTVMQAGGDAGDSAAAGGGSSASTSKPGVVSVGAGAGGAKAVDVCNWVKCYSSMYDCYYYENKLTWESTWQEPAPYKRWRLTHPDEAAKSDLALEEEAGAAHAQAQAAYAQQQEQQKGAAASIPAAPAIGSGSSGGGSSSSRAAAPPPPAAAAGGGGSSAKSEYVKDEDGTWVLASDLGKAKKKKAPLPRPDDGPDIHSMIYSQLAKYREVMNLDEEQGADDADDDWM